MTGLLCTEIQVQVPYNIKTFIFDDLHSTSVIRYALLAYMGYMIW